MDLCQTSVAHLAPAISGLDVNLGLAKTFPTLMERTSLTGTSDVKAGLAENAGFKKQLRCRVLVVSCFYAFQYIGICHDQNTLYQSTL